MLQCGPHHFFLAAYSIFGVKGIVHVKSEIACNQSYRKKGIRPSTAWDCAHSTKVSRIRVGCVAKSSYGSILPCSVFVRYILASMLPRSGRPMPC
jgi:hypothetical protein